MAARGAIGGASDERTSSPRAAGRPPAVRHDDPSGFERSRAGARSAALAYTTTLAQRLLYLEPDDAAVAIRAVTAQASADAITAKAVDELRTARKPLASGTGATWWVVQPLAARIDAYEPDRARISVWLVHVLSRRGVAVPQSSWSTESVELVWERGDWRLWASTSTAGPTPVLDGSDMPANAAQLDGQLAGFELVDRWSDQ
jgi:hypothetical protein